MKIVNKYADFSAISIGKVSVIDTDAQRMLGYFSNVSQSKKNAFNELIVDLKNKGIYDKITFMSLPILASNLNEAYINVIDGASVATEHVAEAGTITDGGISTENGTRNIMSDVHNYAVDKYSIISMFKPQTQMLSFFNINGTFGLFATNTNRIQYGQTSNRVYTDADLQQNTVNAVCVTDNGNIGENMSEGNISIALNGATKTTINASVEGNVKAAINNAFIFGDIQNAGIKYITIIANALTQSEAEYITQRLLAFQQ